MPFVFEGVDHVQLAAPEGSENQARKFFAELLGMEEVEKPEALKKRGGVWFQCGIQQIHIGIEKDFSPAKKAHPALVVKNIDQLMSHLSKKEAAYQKDDKLPNAKRIYLEDPFGNRIEILEWQS
ncbi:Catechol 2,3-dioxygenase [Thalassobacillus cyri]|uniref:Catechol 2,3-dioxygenase n=1 Tax=Thalassobacillus cyri TaxID=571932 RepID=A0A1H4GCZ9_9BACI|nr:VOC family protein [Thalassobacillus cyri]SEB07485.1 Catechol 2,3-dioxygenase [Thalassobacillus cyri]